MRWLLVSLLMVGCKKDGAGDSAASFPESGTLRVLTYNVHALPDGLTNTPQPGLERMAAINPMLDAFDLMGMQELFVDENYEALVEGQRHGIRKRFDEVLSSDRAYGSGLAILSAVGSEVAYTEEHYTTCNGLLDAASDCLASKGVHILTLDLGRGAPLSVINTHHEAGGSDDDEAARTVQVDQVVAAIQALPADNAIVFMGDFNMKESDPPDVPELQKYADLGLRNSCVELDCLEPERIDRLYVRDGAALTLTPSDWEVQTQFVDDDGLDLSDHEAIAITLAWGQASR